MLQMSYDADKVVFNLKGMQKFATTAPRKRLLDIGFELMRLSQKEVPHDKGTLQNSGKVETFGENVVVGYHTAYAHRLHEHPEYHFQRGRKGKYLTDPLIRNLPVFNKHLEADLQYDLDASIE